MKGHVVSESIGFADNAGGRVKSTIVEYLKATGMFLLMPWAVQLVVALFFLLFSAFTAGGSTSKHMVAGLSAALSVLASLAYFAMGSGISTATALPENFLIFSKKGENLNDEFGLAMKTGLISFLSPIMIALIYVVLALPYEKMKYSWFYYILIAVLVAPSAEEYFFRQVLYSYCRKHQIPNWALFSAFVFTMSHGISFSLSSVVLFFSSMAFSYLCLAKVFQLTRKLIYPIINHMLWNIASAIAPLFVHRIGTTARVVVAIVCLSALAVSTKSSLEELRSLSQEEGDNSDSPAAAV